MPKKTVTKSATDKKAATKKTTKKVPAAKKKSGSKSPSSKAKGKSASAKSEPAEPSREVVYPKVRTELAELLTAKKAKELLGWQEETENVKFGDDYLFKTPGDSPRKIRCDNDVTNRPLNMGNVLKYVQEILRGKWRLNGETIIVGKTGLVLNGQHQLIAVVLANEMCETNGGKWCETWPEGNPGIPKLVVFGVNEDDDTVNTMDTCKPRTLADVIYRSRFFADVASRQDRKTVSNMLQGAVRLMWDRTGMKSDAYNPYMSHSEAIDFVERHERLLECVKHVFEANVSNAIGKYIPAGYAAGLLYLMAVCETDEDDNPYVTGQPNPSEASLDFSAWDDACDFWVKLAAGDKKLEAVRQVIAATKDEESGSTPACVGLLVKAWAMYYSGAAVTVEALQLQYEEDEDGFAVLAEHPALGGIDLVPTGT